MIDPPPAKIMYCYGEFQQLFCNYSHVDFRRGLPDIDEFDGGEPVLLIIDDLMDETNEAWSACSRKALTTETLV